MKFRGFGTCGLRGAVPMRWSTKVSTTIEGQCSPGYVATRQEIVHCVHKLVVSSFVTQ